MPFREPPPSPAALRSPWRAEPLSRTAAIHDLSHSGLLAGTLLGPAASVGSRHVATDVLEAISRRKGPVGFGGPAALAEAVSRPLLPSTDAEINAMLDEARRQLEPRDIVDESGTAYPPVSPPWMPPSRDRLQHHLEHPSEAMTTFTKPPPGPGIDSLVNCTCGRRLGACVCETVWRPVHGDGSLEISPGFRAAVAMCERMLQP